ncbi:hypothetical protein B5M47_00180 [candidate division CPR3 bacterium 4484_211]|uniref:Uncharacterized protein n=1 Tax=candidate division CPR3 bacterium 4484_211 TaxID=1968527 RepID=A0A1W9P026_UNCC3|nr:MAG: hypothetical protein B5M47_00180 [candidate division CPR3 bacterium 4484_211]
MPHIRLNRKAKIFAGLAGIIVLALGTYLYTRQFTPPKKETIDPFSDLSPVHVSIPQDIWRFSFSLGRLPSKLKIYQVGFQSLPSPAYTFLVNLAKDLNFPNEVQPTGSGDILKIYYQQRSLSVNYKNGTVKYSSHPQSQTGLLALPASGATSAENAYTFLKNQHLIGNSFSYQNSFIEEINLNASIGITSTQKSLAGRTITFFAKLDGIPVYGNYLNPYVMLNAENKIFAFSSSLAEFSPSPDYAAVTIKSQKEVQKDLQNGEGKTFVSCPQLPQAESVTVTKGELIYYQNPKANIISPIFKLTVRAKKGDQECNAIIYLDAGRKR